MSKPITIPSEILEHIMFGTAVMPAPRSRHPQDVFCPHVLPLPVARSLKQQLPDSLHLIEYPPHIGELWLAKEWNESISRRIQNKQIANDARVVRTAKDEVFVILAHYLTYTMKMPAKGAEEVARSMVDRHGAVSEGVRQDITPLLAMFKLDKAISLLSTQ
jgi:hypothetical protein